MTQVHARDSTAGTPSHLPGVQLRPAFPAEEEAVMALRRACGWSAESVPQQFRAVRDGRREIWIAECDGYLVATVTAEWFADDPQLADGRTRAHISNLVVHAAYRRRGIARALMTCVERAAAHRGCSVITIGVDQGNTYARALYERRGYAHFKDVDASWGVIHILQQSLEPDERGRAAAARRCLVEPLGAGPPDTC